ncbi:helix-turn-helix domain-containing protein [Paraburkholderia sp. NMBU_R16]|uniref:helix-turn-helix transcriptional regulator n=1 Tax=Paraburkholderia sp. NMBU_R16 TaxID=2698676 RepID=UPI001566AF5C|nr:helix-turn-helix domain-containing protein [Paraburkholderia sp. NMBU_R16]NRO99126.1 helix-turn-helix domain-containing protein [Paraburkholderia sp. NMBU_R16]
MFSTIYFAASSILAADDVPATLTSKVLEGRFAEAVRLAANLTDIDSDQGTRNLDRLQTFADLQLILGRHEEAEETYRRAQKSVRHSRNAMRIVSCRNTGWQALFRSQFSVALSCFKRNEQERTATIEQRLDNLVGSTLVLFHLGRIQDACASLAELSSVASTSGDQRWCDLASALAADLHAQQQLLCSEHLADHIYWRSVIADFSLDSAIVCQDLSTCTIPVLARRGEYLGYLLALARGELDAWTNLKDYAGGIRNSALGDYHRTLCLEIALAALAGRFPTVAEGMLDASGIAASKGVQHARWYLDYLYCRAKVLHLQARVQEFAHTFEHYALVSLKHVRADNVALAMITPQTATQPSRNEQAPDEVSSRLPAKYRRAYRYLMDNLDQRNLTVREVAAHIGVTERAVQAAFKNHLGLSPSELIRRERMERIRNDLLGDGAPVSRYLDVARRWGVGHRSTLTNGYRSVFKELPSETLGR